MKQKRFGTLTEKPLTTSFGSPHKPVTHYVVMRSRKPCVLAFFGFHERGVLVVARPNDTPAIFRVHADARSRLAQLESAKAEARRAITRTREIIGTVKNSLLSEAGARLLADRGRFQIIGVRD